MDVMTTKKTEFDEVADQEDETSMTLTSAEFVVEASCVSLQKVQRILKIKQKIGIFSQYLHKYLNVNNYLRKL
jgi:hypothetical protein